MSAGSTVANHFYTALCKRCGMGGRWHIDGTMAWEDFYNVTKQQHYPTFINPCERCEMHTVWELTGISSKPEEDESK